LKAILLSLTVFRVFPIADCVRVVIPARHFRSSIPHAFVFCAETEKGQLLIGIAPFLNIPILPNLRKVARGDQAHHAPVELFRFGCS
jgi:hypothetical protein